MGRTSPYVFVMMLSLFGCGGGTILDDDDTVGDDDSAGDDDDSTVGDDDDSAGPPPCAGHTWGHIDDPEAAIHVRVDGSDLGDGTPAAPVATLEAALELSRLREADKRIAVGPGSFDTHIVVREDVGKDLTDNGLLIQGCGPGETTLTGLGAADEESIVWISEAEDVRLAGMTLRGGRRPLVIWNGATAEVEAVEVVDHARIGIVITGAATVVSLTDVQVRDIVTDTGIGEELGYGIGIGYATVDLNRVDVSNSRSVGILIDFAEVALTEVSVNGTQPSTTGHLGRGVMAQEYAMVTMERCEIGTTAPNHDAGVFSHAALWLELDDVIVHGTLAGNLWGETCTGDDCPGDGIVVTQGGLGEDPANFYARLTGNTVTGSARAGILIDSVTTELSGNVAGADNGYSHDGQSIFVQGQLHDGQGDSIVSGDQHPPPTELGEPLPLCLGEAEPDS